MKTKIMHFITVVVFIFLMCFRISNTDQHEKTDADEEFVPSKEWKEIKNGQKIPAGLHYRINLSTGKKEAKIIDNENDVSSESSKNFILQEKGYDVKNALNNDEIEEILKDVNRKNPENDMPKKFRTLEEIKKELGNINLQSKSDVEILKKLFNSYERERKKKHVDENVVLSIIRDLKYLGHQIDNGNEFFKMSGFTNIVYKELNSTNPAIKQEALKLFSVLAQNNPKVKVHILETGGITILLRILSIENNPFIKNSALTALSCTLRTFPYAQNKFTEIGGLKVITDLLKTEPIKMKLKIVTLLNDFITERQTDRENFENHHFIDIEMELYNLNWCDYLNKLLHDLLIIDMNDFDSVEKCLLAMKSLMGKCKHLYEGSIILKLHNQYNQLAKKSRDDADYLKYLSDLTYELITDNFDKQEL